MNSNDFLQRHDMLDNQQLDFDEHNDNNSPDQS